MGVLASARPSFGQAAQAPPLGAASSFGLFTSSGSLTNVGVGTRVVGNIGTDFGMINGFLPGTYTGAVEIRNAASALAQKGVADAYTFMTDIVGGTAHGTGLGSETLAPGIYRLVGASTLAGELVLDGQGDPGAVFIIKIAGALSTEALSNVRLINAAAWENVFWQVTSTVSLGTSAKFRGTILANNAISFMANTVLQGRALTQSGDITLINNKVTTSPVPLPVELTRFTAESRSDDVLLRWATASERNNAYFAVQSSPDGARYTTVGKVGGHGSTSSPQAYAWTDAHVDRYAAEVVYYRLVQVDADSSKHYSPVRTVACAPVVGLQLRVYPSPSQLSCWVRIEAQHAGPATLRLTNALGHCVAEYHYPLLKGTNSLPLEEARALAPGVYLVQVQQGAEHQSVRLVHE